MIGDSKIFVGYVAVSLKQEFLNEDSWKFCDGGYFCYVVLVKWNISCIYGGFCVNFWWLQVLVVFVCDLELDIFFCCVETYKWVWFRRYCMVFRVVVVLDKRISLFRLFFDEVLYIILELFLECKNVFFIQLQYKKMLIL